MQEGQYITFTKVSDFQLIRPFLEKFLGEHRLSDVARNFLQRLLGNENKLTHLMGRDQKTVLTEINKKIIEAAGIKGLKFLLAQSNQHACFADVIGRKGPNGRQYVKVRIPTNDDWRDVLSKFPTELLRNRIEEIRRDGDHKGLQPNLVVPLNAMLNDTLPHLRFFGTGGRDHKRWTLHQVLIDPSQEKVKKGWVLVL